MGERYVTMSNTATTDAVTASSTMLALDIALPMSAPNAGPPVSSIARPAGAPAVADRRSASMVSLSADPDVTATGIGVTAARPSGETMSGGPVTPAVDKTR